MKVGDSISALTSSGIPNTRYFRKVIQIRAEDSPNVRYAAQQLLAGIHPDNTEIVPGVLSYREYRKRRKTWDKVRQCIGLDAEFYEGATLLLFPPDWLNHSEEYADTLSGRRRIARGIGIDPGEGGANTAMSAVDEFGLIEMISRQTPDTTEIIDSAITFIKKWKVPHERVLFDRGGGGKQHADRLRRMGYKVGTVAFGEPPTMEPRRGRIQVEERKEAIEERYTYVNRRAQMYGTFSILMDPSAGPGFAIPREYARVLRQQLAPIPLTYDKEGRLYILPKNRRSQGSKERTLIDIIGHSPDEADSVVIAIHAMRNKNVPRKMRAIV